MKQDNKKQEYVKPTMDIMVMMPEECLASNPYWNGSDMGWWGSPACERTC